MKKILILLALSLLMIKSYSQESNQKKSEFGGLFSTRIDSRHYSDFEVNGFGVEGGVYYLDKFGKKGMLSIEFRLAYAHSNHEYENAIRLYEFRNNEHTTRTGPVRYRNLALSLPIKYRYQINKKSPWYVLIGFSPNFNLINSSEWTFDEFEYNRTADTFTLMKRDQTENLDQRFYSSDILLLGFGYKFEKMMFDINFSGGAMQFDNEFIMGMGKLSLVFNTYYELD